MNALPLLAMLLLVAEPAAAPQSNDPAHAELLKVRSGLIDAYNRRNVDGILAHCHPKIVVTWQNAEVTEGREGVRGYYEKMMTGPNRIVESMTADPTVDHLAIIYGGDTAVSRGAMNDHYQLTDGTEFDLNSRWSATLVKEGDTWLIANFHASAGAFDNPLLKLIVSRASLWAGVAGAAGGTILAATLSWMLTRRRHAKNPS